MFPNKINIEGFIEGFFYFFGFTDNPVEKKSKDIVKTTSAQKIKEDLKRINKDYREQYSKMRKEAMCIE